MPDKIVEILKANIHKRPGEFKADKGGDAKYEKRIQTIASALITHLYSAGEEVYVVVTEPDSVYVEGSFTVKFPDMTIRRLKLTTRPTVSEEEIEQIIREFKRIDAWGSKKKSTLTMTKVDLAEYGRVERLADLKKDKAIKELTRPTDSAGEEVRACPCTYLDEPCKENCTCKNPFSSAGCEYCCSYGSVEQRKAKAEYLQKKLTRPTVSEEEITFEQCLREEFLINTQNYPKEYHSLFHKKFKRAEERFKELLNR